MKFTRIFAFLIVAIATGSFFACQDENSNIGSVIAPGEVNIVVDTFLFETRDLTELNIQSIQVDNFDSRTGNLLIGNIYAPQYGSLECSFVTRLMCVPNMNVPDSLLLPERVDSCKLILGASRSDITGDTLAPQKLSVYRLNKQLPGNLDNTFNPDGYYDPKTGLLGSLSYTVSNIADKDSMYFYGSYINLDVDLPKSFGQSIFENYINNPDMFAWPQTMAEKFLPGLYFESTFGNGCVANIMEVFVGVYYHSLKTEKTVSDGDTIYKVKHVTNLALPFSVSPEVLSSNNIIYKPAESISTRNANAPSTGECLLTTPGGFMASFNFPFKPLLNEYKEKNIHLSTVNELLFYLPAEAIEADNGIGVAENLLLIKASEYESFFNENKVPDDKTSFTGVWDASYSQYIFSSMREYFVSLLEKDTITQEDIEFIILPVDLTTETETNNYYGTSNTYVTKCVPATKKPSLTLIKLGEAEALFSFSTQIID